MSIFTETHLFSLFFKYKTYNNKINILTMSTILICLPLLIVAIIIKIIRNVIIKLIISDIFGYLILNLLLLSSFENP